MNELLRKQAITIMNRLMEHPSTTPFLNSDPSDPEPISLLLVKEKLEKNQYSVLKEWIDDVDATWSHISKSIISQKSQKGSENILYLVEANKKLFEKEKNSISILTPTQWGSEICRLRSYISSKLTQPPPKIKPHAAVFGTSRYAKPDIHFVSEKEFEDLIQATAQLKSDKDNDALLKIIQEKQPEILTSSNNTKIDVAKLSGETIEAIQNYIKTVREKPSK